MNQSEFLAITCHFLKAREKSRVPGASGFGFASLWLKYWQDILKPITKLINRNRVITFESRLKTAVCPGLHSIKDACQIEVTVWECPFALQGNLIIACFEKYMPA